MLNFFNLKKICLLLLLSVNHKNNAQIDVILQMIHEVVNPQIQNESFQLMSGLGYGQLAGVSMSCGFKSKLEIKNKESEIIGYLRFQLSFLWGTNALCIYANILFFKLGLSLIGLSYVTGYRFDKSLNDFIFVHKVGIAIERDITSEEDKPIYLSLFII